MNILKTIIENKRVEIREAKQRRSLSALESMPGFNRQPLSMKKFLLDENRTGIIAEFKRKSPSKGIINDWSTIEEVTRSYYDYGASAISVLTDEKFFGGHLSDLESARANHLPLLRKDFMIDEYQVIEAKAFGADVILLIAACLSATEVRQLASLAKTLGMEVLLEIHNEVEMEMFCDEVDLAGINNRDLTSFRVDIQTSFDLVEMIPRSALPVAESGITSVESIVSLKKAGFKGFLIGENFMKHKDPAIAFADFVKQLKAAQ